MERVTTRLPERQIEDIETLVENGEFPNKSEVLRAGLRNVLGQYSFEGEEVTRQAVE